MKKALLILIGMILAPTLAWGLSSTVYRLGGNYGIATSTPAYLLDVYGNTRIDGDLTVSGTGNTTIAGKVGIGTTSPATKLDVNGNITMGDNLYVGDYGTITSGFNADSEESISLTSSQSVDIKIANNGYFNVFNDDSWQFYVSGSTGRLNLKGNIYLRDGGNIGPHTDNDLMQLSDNQLIINGNVGIGTSTPPTKLTIDGACFELKSPDGSRSQCCVDNSDALTCTGL